MSMNTKTTTLAVSLVFSSSLLTGCATMQETQQMGGAALGGLAAGITTGLLTGDVGLGIAAGVAGAAVGWGAVKLMQPETEQVRTAEEDNQLYGLAPASDKVLIKLNKGYASPKTISAGEQVKIHSDYSLSVPESYNNQTDVTAVWTLKKEDEVILKTEPAVRNKTAGGHLVEHPFNIPADAEPGTYVVETHLSSGTVYDLNEAVFIVK